MSNPVLHVSPAVQNSPARITLLQCGLFAVVVLDVLLIGMRVLTYPSFLQQPDNTIYILEPIALLIVYAVLMLALMWHPGRTRLVAIQIGTPIGLTGATLWIISLTIETFAQLSAPASLLGTAPFLLGGFFLWGVSGFLSARRTGSIPHGILAAVWAGMITALLAVTYGFVLGMVSLPRLAELIAGSPEQLRSGWQDLLAFAIANQFDAGFTHLLGALFIGCITGAIGAVLGQLLGGTQSSTNEPIAG